MFGMGNIGTFASLAGSLGGMFGDSPGDAAAPYLKKAGEDLRLYSNDYIDRGTRAQNTLEDLFKNIRENPQSIMDLLGKGYQQSPGFDWNMKRSQQAINNASAAGGMLGTPQHEQQSADMASALSSRDFGDYMQRMMGIWGTGVQGTENFANRGWDASKTLMEDLANLGGAQGAYAAQDTAGRNKGMSNMFSGAASILGPMVNGGAGGSSMPWMNPDNGFSPEFY